LTLPKLAETEARLGLCNIPSIIWEWFRCLTTEICGLTKPERDWQNQFNTIPIRTVGLAVGAAVFHPLRFDDFETTCEAWDSGTASRPGNCTLNNVPTSRLDFKPFLPTTIGLTSN